MGANLDVNKFVSEDKEIANFNFKAFLHVTKSLKILQLITWHNVKMRANFVTV